MRKTSSTAQPRQGHGLERRLRMRTTASSSVEVEWGTRPIGVGCGVHSAHWSRVRGPNGVLDHRVEGFYKDCQTARRSVSGDNLQPAVSASPGPWTAKMKRRSAALLSEGIGFWIPHVPCPHS
jgi:hypothetical protein